MSGLLKGVGMGVAFSAAMLIPWPILVGGVLIYGCRESRKQQALKLTRSEAKALDDADLTGVDLRDPSSVDRATGELDELRHVLNLMDKSSDPDAVWQEWNA